MLTNHTWRIEYRDGSEPETVEAAAIQVSPEVTTFAVMSKIQNAQGQSAVEPILVIPHDLIRKIVRVSPGGDAPVSLVDMGAGR